MSVTLRDWWSLTLNNSNRVFLWRGASVGVVVMVMSGCAAYRECGFRGCPGDAQISSEVQALFQQHSALEPPNLISVQTLNHVVYLYGIVATDLQRQLAEAVAASAPGVVKVVNSIGLDNITQ